VQYAWCQAGRGNGKGKEEMTEETYNHLYYGDNLDILRRYVKDETVDLIYLDPPYNQHPYGSNYFMLNLICTNERPHTLSKVSGIPGDWNKSQYNYKNKIKLYHLIFC